MITFPEAIKRAFAQYATFAGRATRPEYWWFYLFSVLAWGVPYALLLASLPGTGESVGGLFWFALLLLIVAVLVLLVPGISVTVRRLHDTGKSGWWFPASVASGSSCCWSCPARQDRTSTAEPSHPMRHSRSQLCAVVHKRLP